MASPQLKILVSLAGVSIVYAFVCEIQLSRKASKLRNWLQQERPDLWSELNFFARNWNGGQPGLKILYRRNVVGLPMFDQQYKQLRSLERKLLCGIGIGSVYIALVLVGSRFWGWHWWNGRTSLTAFWCFLTTRSSRTGQTAPLIFRSVFWRV